ncbi:uncharacterized protein LOC111298866 isoform X2 [Durio zibethinus]|uniref:Uncharacterized protein LOC111298866 isoform X2 n=1 Tax=Durio zibethinus TaxID=66656 RepID=A0A6P5Z9Y2_DURZI|nr:uncharacterized protein LOC111298866 isoform X2 [Durio zibethinus]
MHPQVAQSEASNQQHRRFFQRRKNKRKNNALNRQKKKEYARVAAENRHLTGIIEGMISQYLKVQGKNFQKHENYVSHLAGENDHRSFYAQDQQCAGSHIGGNDDELDVMNGLALNELDNPLSNEVKNPKNSQTIQKSTMSEFLKKIDDDVASSNDFSDFMVCFDGEHKKIGRYSFPLSLVSTVERITNVYGDVSAPCLKNSSVTEKIYLFFCATIKEMEDLKLHQVTEKKLLKWRDAIKDALRINFKVAFAMHHLKRIARAYFGCIGSQELQSIGDKLDALNKERAETYQDFKDYIAYAKDFYGKSVSDGLFA